MNRRLFLLLASCMLPVGAYAEDAVPGARVAPAPANDTRTDGAACCGPVTEDGEHLRRFLDDSGVDHLWLPDYRVDWRTGAALEMSRPGSGPHTHCSAFAGSAAMRLGVYLLRPPEHGQTLLANAQVRWLDTPEAAASGWRALPDAFAAQTQANRGALVVAAVENPDPRRAGHVALVRPGPIAGDALRRSGPMVTMAGAHNALAVSLAEGFRTHHGAWLPGGGGSAGFHAHEVDWRAVLA
ncbi:hypothetical protein OVY01_07295 [Robbsia sp. Bb-Pol-6]|uniref:Uncharacterized protein n=1 Tax=Robbsia betulipollinis TaxID=2981849 RepID=A0ABT3ZKI1_9BURK|nr:hypothetical protein [Robbsia betulipollinis]MCY0387040.1 hypothetical protein [Robbsia betulipollinis]